MNWFEVDKEGLAKLLERKGKEYVILELIQNSWDQNTNSVEVTLDKLPNSRHAIITVRDEDPDGFRNLAHAFTLFAESEKKTDATKRGRFNIGEKLVLALCDEAEIISTRGGIRFDAKGRHNIRRKLSQGTIFTAKVRMTNDEVEAAKLAFRRLIPPKKVKTSLNGESFIRPDPIATFIETLPTEIANNDGILRRVTRKTVINVYEPSLDETGTLYEMGIPVVETGDTYHVDIQQKIPLTMDRDNVPPAFLRQVRAFVLNHVHDRLDLESSNQKWVKDALSDEHVSDDAVKTVVENRFGEKSVAYDPSDPEANKLAVSQGFTVVHGPQMSKAEWDRVRPLGVLRPAGQVTPSPKPFHEDGEPLKVLPSDKWSEQERVFVERIQKIAFALIGKPIHVTLANDPGWNFGGAYGSGSLTINRLRYGAMWFCELGVGQLKFLIHELAHEYSRDHLSQEYHDALCRLGAKLALLFVEYPAMADLKVKI